VRDRLALDEDIADVIEALRWIDYSAALQQ
jgi:hypothetical protein